MKETEYRPINGFMGYRVGDDGSIWSQWKIRQAIGLKGSYSEITGEWQRISPGVCKRTGRCHVNLRSDNGQVRTVKVHRIVLMAFRGDPPPGCVCCHNDGNPSNNTIDNLRWDTLSSNQADRKKHGTEIYGERNGIRKLTTDQVLEIIQRCRSGETQRSVSKLFGIANQTVSRLVNRKRWSHLSLSATDGTTNTDGNEAKQTAVL